jgi:hypothetical protein
VKYIMASLLPMSLFVSEVEAATVTWTAGNQHRYEAVITNGGDIDPSLSWEAAKTAAESRFTPDGQRGYLAAVASQDENAFIYNSFEGLFPRGPTGAYDEGYTRALWLGGQSNRDIWAWATGPEAGRVFSVGPLPTPPDNFVAWGGNEPNGYPGVDVAWLGMTFGGELGYEGIFPGQWFDGEEPPNFIGIPVAGYVVEYAPIPIPGSLALLLSALFATAFAARGRWSAYAG